MRPGLFQSPFLRLWGWPLAMALLSATGLASALLFERWGDWWSWLGLGIPVAVIGWFSWPRARPVEAATDADTPAPPF
ncbi:hypothetical protein [Verminephrobacter aporrectodeae]|uniref:hypothetical protein n=1 Tax=Verminephrobacter aporrectodeae TaxID=1110389 RepID=UPI002237867B|nr:hypothetical protein [Verminephrobacter aporrectodeae]MCW5222136.1 hypothetical protein [Verminephrobacter aporrectodeae subsp. tuberculatae]MCW5291427.1 hypothetical protein [Verminephrobacter aporrectodeae subsp. tuberculatae]MCW8175736.1 hypothetical protein [Verminephrobacter aporrectodeae subsp. tuberculatae]MCW8198651.1 hypothetical protein [Verminephrobacter aporrectodeae subsp. tuberculatae]MCW8203298.1 hypothetical protein [Verminephrobacter aporrectodeae subsp. tuberculatae]